MTAEGGTDGKKCEGRCAVSSADIVGEGSAPSWTKAFRCLFLKGSYAAMLEVCNDPGLYGFRFKRNLGDFRVQVSVGEGGLQISRIQCN